MTDFAIGPARILDGDPIVVGGGAGTPNADPALTGQTTGPVTLSPAGSQYQLVVLEPEDDAVLVRSFSVRLRVTDPNATQPTSGEHVVGNYESGIPPVLFPDVLLRVIDPSNPATVIDYTTSIEQHSGTETLGLFTNDSGTCVTVAGSWPDPPGTQITGTYEFTVTFDFTSEAAAFRGLLVGVKALGYGTTLGTIYGADVLPETLDIVSWECDRTTDGTSDSTSSTTGALGVGMFVQFGLDATGPADESFTWTTRGDLRVQDSITIRRGRTADSPQIGAGSATFTLDNRDGRYDPDGRFGALRTGTPVRIRADVTAAGLFDPDLFDDTLFDTDGTVRSATIWKGTVERRPSRTEGVDRTVDVEAVDVIGLAAQASAPVTAWSAVVSDLAPDAWWQPTETAWSDEVTGRLGRHSAALGQVDPLVSGGDRSYASAEPGEGYGVVEGGPFIPVTGNTLTVVLFRFNAPEDGPPPSGLVRFLEQRNTTGATQFAVGHRVGPNAIEIGVSGLTTARFRRTLTGNPLNLYDGRTHMIAMDGGDNPARLWIDGVPQQIQAVTSGPSATDPGRLLIGAGEVSDVTTVIDGCVSDVVAWGDYPRADVPAAVTAMWEACRDGWSGQRLDERLATLATHTGLAPLLGALEPSAVTTHRPYVTGDVVTLLQTIEDTEQGRIWVDRDGNLRFSARQWAWTDPTATTVQAWFSDRRADIETGALPMLDGLLEVVDDPADVSNVADVQSETGLARTARAPASVAAYGTRNPRSLSGLLHDTDEESATIAQWLVLSGATPKTRVQRLAFQPSRDPRLAELLQTVDEGHLWRVTTQGRDLYGHVAGITHEIAETWTATVDLDPSRTGWEWFTWGSSAWNGTEGWAF